MSENSKLEVNLERLFPRAPWVEGAISNQWQDFVWLEWVPVKCREQIESFWSEDWNRGPRAWLKDMDNQRAPITGQVYDDLFVSRSEGPVIGIYLHAWNNMGRLVLQDGSYKVCSFHHDYPVATT